MMNCKMRYMCLLALTLFVFSSTRVPAQAADRLAATPITEFKVAGSPLYQVLASIALKYKAPIGFEEITPGATVKINLNIKKGTLADVLNELVRQDPRYEWAIVDEVVNVKPREAQFGILDVRIGRLRLDLGDRSGAYTELISQPEVKERMKHLGVSPLRMDFGSFADSQSRSVSVEVGDSTLRTALNKIVISSEAHFWSVTRYGEGDEFLILNF